ncbi:MAG: four-carbon acid sugar kinase family protein, partial [Verrucomicrobia bacterium]|nr:four-carbon acid sugar kinase family protein [Verrucomicrobiota bacterium]
MPSAANSPAKPLVGIIADDLTGAAELAGVAWRLGFTAEIHADSTGTTSAEVIAIDTDSRHCDATEATRRVAAAAQHLKALGVEWIYKKVDSVLRGSVLVETEALLDVLKLNRALLVPANPGLGRVIRDGKYFIAGTPVHETDFRNDPQHPRTSAQVLEMLGRSATRSIIVCRPDQPLPAGGIVVGEAAAKEDLQ